MSTLLYPSPIYGPVHSRRLGISLGINLTLSEQRAQTVQTQIVAAGYPSARIVHVKGYGESNPVASNATAAGQEQNRRVEVYILPSKEMIEAANAQSK